jgi:hypothetical protein
MIVTNEFSHSSVTLSLIGVDKNSPIVLDIVIL